MKIVKISLILLCSMIIIPIFAIICLLFGIVVGIDILISEFILPEFEK